MFIKHKRLMCKCRACGTEGQLDDAHRAGTTLMKNLPKDMSEIDTKKPNDDKKGEEEDSDKEKKPKKAEVADEELKEEDMKLDSEEIGKFSEAKKR